MHLVRLGLFLHQYLHIYLCYLNILGINLVYLTLEIFVMEIPSHFCFAKGRQRFLQNYKLRRRFSQGAIQPIREILDEMEERRKEEDEEKERRERQTGKQKFVGAVRKVKNVRIFLARDETASDEENDDHLYEGKKNST